MREVISLHLGQCGNQIAVQFWDKVAEEHKINKDGRYTGTQPEHEMRYANVFFREAVEDHYVPRAVLIDTEPSAVKAMLSELDFESFFPKQNIILANGSSASNSWATGYQFGSSSSGIGAQVVESVRSELEACDALQGLQMTHSLGGGRSAVHSRCEKMGAYECPHTATCALFRNRERLWILAV